MRSTLRRLPGTAIRRFLAAAAVAFAALVLVAPTVATAPLAPAAPPASQPPPAVDDSRLSPELLGVPIDSSQYAVARRTYETARQNFGLAQDAYYGAVAALGSLTGTEARLVTQIETAQRRRQQAEQRLAELRLSMEALAVASYVQGGLGQTIQTDDLDLDDAAEHGQEQALVRVVTDHHREDFDLNVRIRDHSTREIDRSALVLDGTRRRIAETTVARDRAGASALRLGAEVEQAAKAVSDSRMTAQVVGADFPLVAMDAFWRAAGKVNGEAPQCGLRWTILAGISRVEGVHGTWGGSSLDGDGATTQRITGPPLNGSRNTAVVGDTDGGLWDDDTTWDRGVGPMGFIPTSWRIFGSDGNGDNDLDPHNIYDAAEASARLLCWASAGLDTDPGLRAALFRYNRSQKYVDIVVNYIRGYDSLGLPPA
jgi:membrane-bound lytic murein transglycosylase B